MPRRVPVDNPKPLPPPAKTLEGRENQLIDAAFTLAEKRIHNETASSQEVVHFLRLGTTRERLEQQKLKQENIVLQARVKEMESRTSNEALYAEALRAFKGYSGQTDPFADEEYDEDL